MTLKPTDTWAPEDHTLVKLQILSGYLKAWFSILCPHHKIAGLTYIDAGCGFGEYSTGDPGSPMIAIRAATQAKNSTSKPIHFYFIDRRQEAIDHLQQLLNREPKPINFRVDRPVKGEIEDELPRLLHIIESRPSSSAGLQPLFAFIDGFGNVVSMNTLRTILNMKSAEVFVFLNPSDISRNLSPSSDLERTVQVFGTEEVRNSPPEKWPELYLEQLRRSGAVYACCFELQDAKKRRFYLCFATKSGLGFMKMKEAMWRVDQWGDLTFSDALDPEHELLFNKHEVASQVLMHAMCKEFYGHKATGKEVNNFVELRTMYLPSPHKTLVLQALEREGRIVRPTMPDGSKARKGNFPDACTIAFPERCCGCAQCRLPG